MADEYEEDYQDEFYDQTSAASPVRGRNNNDEDERLNSHNATGGSRPNESEFEFFEDDPDGTASSNPSSAPYSRRDHRNRNQDEDDEQQQQKINGKIESLQSRVDQLENELFSERQLSLEIRQKYEKELDGAWNEMERSKNDSNYRIKDLEDRLKNQSSEKPSTPAPTSTSDHGKNENEVKLEKEVKRLKKQCEILQEQLDLSLITNPSSSSANNSANNSVVKGGGGAMGSKSSNPNINLEILPQILQDELFRFCNKQNNLSDLKNLDNLTVSEALRILQQLQRIQRAANKKGNGNQAGGGGAGDASSVGSDSNEPPEAVIQQKLAAYHQHHKLSDKIKSLEEELKLAASHADDINHLKNRILALTERVRVEKEYKRNFETELISTKRKLDMLTDHVEKLVIHIKREGTQKVKYAEEYRIQEKDMNKLKEKYDNIAKKLSLKDRLIYELREGSKVLEDQLKLMDEKYLELRNKLDYARYSANKKVTKLTKEASTLRMKFAMVSGNANLPLDSISLPPNSAGSYPGANYGQYSGGNGGSYNNAGDMSFDASTIMSNTYSPAMRGMNSTNVSFDLGNINSTSNDRVRRNSAGRGRGGGGGDHSPTGAGGMMDSGNSVASKVSKSSAAASVLSLDAVLEKIRLQQNAKQDWTEDKIKKLTQHR